MFDLHTYFHKEPKIYRGPELRPHFLLSQFQIKGTGVVAFIGKCEVSTADLVDWEDRLNQDRIYAESMLHFLGEFFGQNLVEIVFFQRLMISIIADVFRRNSSKKVIRKGDDLFVDGKKLTVSIVTSSAVSQLLHIGVNVDCTGAPVEAIGLNDCDIDPLSFGNEILDRIESEWEGVQWACVKVKPVGESHA